MGGGAGPSQGSQALLPSIPAHCCWSPGRGWATEGTVQAGGGSGLREWECSSKHCPSHGQCMDRPIVGHTGLLTLSIRQRWCPHRAHLLGEGRMVSKSPGNTGCGVSGGDKRGEHKGPRNGAGRRLLPGAQEVAAEDAGRMGRTEGACASRRGAVAGGQRR